MRCICKNAGQRGADGGWQLHAWLQANHASETELWVRIFKKGTGQPSV
eukprot:gene31491-53807_t